MVTSTSADLFPRQQPKVLPEPEVVERRGRGKLVSVAAVVFALLVLVLGGIALFLPGEDEERTDRETLLQVAASNPNWVAELGWDTTTDPCAWEGIFCTLNSVTRVLVADEGLSGEIPAELGELTELLVLNLNGNELTGEIPREFANLRSLQGLSLSNNALTGEIPKELTGLSNLRQLGLNGNSLTGELPAELVNLVNLEQLSLGGNGLTGEIPAELASLADLRGLGLSGNDLTGEIPAELARLANLERLALGGNNFTGEVPAELAEILEANG